jgi:capsular exopolysaccharide synthesis family protein
MNRNEASSSPSDDALPEIDFQETFHILKEKAWLIVTCVFVMLLLAGGYLMTAKKLYAARTVIQVEQSERKVVNIEQINREDLTDLSALKTVEQSLTSRTLYWKVIGVLGLTPEQLGLPPRTEKPYSEKELVDQFESRVKVAMLRGTRLIAIEAIAEDKDLPPKICDAIVSEYVRNNLEQRVQITKDAGKFLLDQAAELKEKLQKSEQALQDYKEKNQSVSLDQSQNIVVEELKVLNSKLSAAKADRLKLESDYDQVQKLSRKSPDTLLQIGSIANALGVLEQKKRLSEQEAEIARLSQRYLPRHPRYIQAQSQLQELKDGLGRAAVREAESLGNSLQAAKETERKMEGALKEQEQRALDLNKMSISYNVLSREVETDRTLYNSVLSRLKETDVTKGLRQEQFRLVETAVASDRPVRPKKLTTLAGALIVGFGMGLTLTFGLNALDSSIKTVDRAEKLLNLPAVGVVPKAASKEGSKDLIALREPHGAVAEAFRTLRTAMSLLGKNSERRTFLFTSAVPGEGKSFCSINFAVALAQQGLKTLIIDADLRLPTIGKRLFNGDPHVGTSDVLVGNVALKEAVRNSEIENLFVLTAGNRAPNPAELIAGGGFGDLLKQALAHFDRVIVDSAPVNAVSDTLLLVREVQSVCLVVHATKTPRKAVIRACNKLTEASGKAPVGMILNQLPVGSGAGYYYHYSVGEYGGVYGAPVAKAKV